MGKQPKRTTSLISRLNRIAARDRLTNDAIGDAIGQHRTTVGKWRKTGSGPKNFFLRDRIEKFVEAREKKAPSK